VSMERLIRRLAAGLAVMIWSSATMVEAGVLGFGKKAPAYTPSGAWEGYFTNDRGVITGPVLQPPESNKDKDWMFLRFTDYSGPKIRVAVMKVDNKTATAQAAADTQAVAVTDNLAQVPVSSIEEMVATAVFNTNRFELVERKEAEKLLEEQDLGASGRAKKSTAPKTGQMIGANYMIFASVNEWTPVKSRAGGAGGRAAGPLGLLGVQKSTAEVAMSFRIVDAATSQQLFTTLERATAENWGFALGGANGGEGGAVAFQKSSPIGYAIQSCINKGVYKLAMWLKDRPWRGAVVKVDGQRVYVNAGSNSGLTTGVELVVLSQGKELIDPVSGESLGKETAVIGILRVTVVQEKFSIADIVDGCKGLKVGDQVELRNTPPIVVTSNP
jgi:curli biogenesis system outer membrane secretion channel CsgG